MKKGSKNLLVVCLVVVALMSSSYALPLVSTMHGTESASRSFQEEERPASTRKPLPIPRDLPDLPPVDDLVLGPDLFDEPVVDEPTMNEPVMDQPEVLPPEKEPVALPPEVEPPTSAPDPRPEVPADPEPSVTKVPSLGRLKELAELEGTQDFSMSTDTIEHRGFRPNDASGIYKSDSDLEREIEESDVIKKVGDHLYILNTYRGLEVVDLSNLDDPEIVTSLQLVGIPLEMYIVGDRAYVIVKTSNIFWYSYSSYCSWWNIYYPRYDIGSRLVILDISQPSHPSIMREIPIEGYVTQNRKVGDVLYLISVCNAYYNIHTGTRLDSLTYVMSVNIADPWDIHAIDQACFDGRSYEIHVTTEHLYVASWERVKDTKFGITTIILVDIGDPHGLIEVMDDFSVEGRVKDRYQMDEHEGTFRVVSYYLSSPRQSELWTFDVRDERNVSPLGHLVIDEWGALMATRFAGERAYVILLPVRDPLYVIDLSDPAYPVICDVFEMPGWVTHMEVRGMTVIALGVDDSNGYQNVAVSLFDVSDPWNVEMLDRVRIGGYRASSTASLDPRAFTVLDDQGQILVPYFSNRWYIDGVLRTGLGVQLVTFDLEEGDLELAGYYKPPDAVIRTRSLGDHVLSLGRDYLLVADTSNIMEPRVTATLDLSPWVVDFRTVEDHYIELVRGLGRKEVLLRVFEEGRHDLTRPLNEVSLGEGVEEWFWSGSELHVVSTAREHHQYKHYWWNATVSTYRFDDLLDIAGPASVNFTLAETDDYYDSFWNIDRCCDVGGHEYRSSLTGQRKVSNPVIVEQDVMTVHHKVIALYAKQQLFLVGVGGASGPVFHSSLEVDCGEFFGLMPAGGCLYVVGVSKYYESRWFYHYRLYPVTLPGLAEPAIGEGIAIPGIPVGSSSDGSCVYTVSRWYIFDRYEFEQTLNVLRIEGGIATLLHAIDVKSMYVNVDGDIANIIMVVRAVGNTQDGIQTWTYYSRVDVVDLRAYVSIQSYWVVEAYYPIYMGQGLIMFKRSGLTGILVMEVGVGTVETALHVDICIGGLVASRDDDYVYIVQYKYGVQHITFAGKGPDPGNSGGGRQIARSPVVVLESCERVSTELTTTLNNTWTFAMPRRPWLP